MVLVLAIVTLLFAAFGATFINPEALALDRCALATGEIWRLWTGHFVHWSFNHLVWDGITFAVLSWLLLKLAPRACFWLLILGPPLISGAVLIAEPGLLVYGGLSGLDVALWVCVCLAVTQNSPDRTTKAAAWLALVGGIGKVGFELATGSAALVSGAFALAPSAHVSGAILGAVLMLLFLTPRSTPQMAASSLKATQTFQ